MLVKPDAMTVYIFLQYQLNPKTYQIVLAALALCAEDRGAGS
jgi:hypothetical protein